MDNFFSILREPDRVIGATEASPFRFEEIREYDASHDVKYEIKLENGCAKIIVYPSDSPVKYLKLRYKGDLSFADKVYGDSWERSGGGCFLEWRSLMTSRLMPWFCYIKGDQRTACYGVKTGADCFAAWSVDVHGITLFLNLTNGNGGTDLKEPLTACEIVELIGDDGEDAYNVAKRFSRLMCEAPVLPKEPIFGVNNWYWAYGDISHEIVMTESDYLMKMCAGSKHRPYMIIDDGWQFGRTLGLNGYIGGPWIPNEKFPDITDTVSKIHRKGAKAGIWFRPLLTLGQIPAEAILDRHTSGGTILDPSHPYTLERVKNDAALLKGYGFDLIKHDFTTIDIINTNPLTAENSSTAICRRNKQFYDKTKTTATIIKNLYKAIAEGAGDADVIGCNCIGHLTAGIHSIYRTGDDTSGRSFEWTRRYGLNSVMRLPTNEAFYTVDPDCAAFTDKVDADSNLDYLEICALTGMTTLASVTPDILTEEQMKRINGIFLTADENKCRYSIKNYDKTANPNIFVSEDKSIEKVYDFEKVYDGARLLLSWTE